MDVLIWWNIAIICTCGFTRKSEELFKEFVDVVHELDKEMCFKMFIVAGSLLWQKAKSLKWFTGFSGIQ